jgi:hypothetical protein
MELVKLQTSAKMNNKINIIYSIIYYRNMKFITGHNKLVSLYAVINEAVKFSQPVYIGRSNRHSNDLEKYIVRDRGYRYNVI